MTEDRDLATRVLLDSPMPGQPETSSYLPFATTFSFEFEKLIEIQKFTLDIYARQTTAAIDAVRMLFPMIPSPFFDAAQRGIIELLRMQMRTLDSTAKQGRD